MWKLKRCLNSLHLFSMHFFPVPYAKIFFLHNTSNLILQAPFLFSFPCTQNPRSPTLDTQPIIEISLIFYLLQYLSSCLSLHLVSKMMYSLCARRNLICHCLLDFKYYNLKVYFTLFKSLNEHYVHLLDVRNKLLL